MKYEPLQQHLEKAEEEIVPLTFEAIETLLHGPLPASARAHSAWWANNPAGHVNAQAWLNAGYRAERIDLAEETVVFRRTAPSAEALKAPRTGRHPIWESPLRGTVKIAPGVDLTEPLWESQDDLS
jgi:hypothetical protein